MSQLPIHSETAPRRIVIACFVAFFVVTVVLAARQYWVLYERELETRQHSLQLQAIAIDTAISTHKKQLLTLRNSAERILLNEHNDPPGAHPPPAFQAIATEQGHSLLGLSVPPDDAPVRALDDAGVLSIPGLIREHRQFSEDTRMALIMSQILPEVHQINVDLTNIFFLSTSGLVVAYPAIRDDQIETALQQFAASKVMSEAPKQPEDFETAVRVVKEGLVPGGTQLSLSTPVVVNGILRGAIVFVVPQQRLQQYMIKTTPSDALHALLDEHGTLIASSEPDFTAADEDGLQTLTATPAALSMATLFQKRSGVITTESGLLLYQQLPNSRLMLVNLLSGATLRWSVIAQFSTVFFFVWALLGMLMVMTLVIVDRLLKGQIALNAQLRDLGLRDPLTQLANRRRLTSDVGALIAGSDATQPISLLMFDIDKFKSINDRWGHSAGDEVLKHLATVCRASVRAQDLVSRYGGEEFCILLPGMSLAEATRRAESLRQTIAESVCVLDDSVLLATAPSKEVRLTVSIGVAEFHADHCTGLESLVATADRRLYAAKHNGRNQVICTDNTLAAAAPG
nr:diguanylate cyclase [Pseudomonas koreensis]